MNLEDTIIVTGAKGLLGSAIVEELQGAGYRKVFGISREDCDLVNQQEVEEVFSRINPDYVFHPAAKVYGLLGVKKNKVQAYYENLVMNTNVVEACRKINVKKILAVGSIKMYPLSSSASPLTENSIFTGTPEPSMKSYAFAKKSMLEMLEVYGDACNINWTFILSCNLFGIRDQFIGEQGRVIPSLIEKFHYAKTSGEAVHVWGTGESQRNFLYVEDAARLMVTIMKSVSGPINIGHKRAYTIKEIVDTLVEVTNYTGEIQWEVEKQTNDSYQDYDLSRMNALDFECKYSLRKGLEKTWQWYLDNKT